MSIETRRVFRYYVLTEYEQEERRLQQMHAQGWAFVRAKVPGIYTFARCTPEECVYRLDFRLCSAAACAGDLEIFSDQAS